VNGPSNPVAEIGANLPFSDVMLALSIAVALSLLIACIEIPSKSKAQIRACFVVHSFFYWLILSVGNVTTTILASLAVVKMPVGLTPYYFVLCPFFGVFGFETVLKNTNVTMFDRGVLTIQNWIEKALNAAAGAAIDQQENIKQEQENKIVAKLMSFSEEDINTRILYKMGPDV
jgi:hypothetical protein